MIGDMAITYILLGAGFLALYLYICYLAVRTSWYVFCAVRTWAIARAGSDRAELLRSDGASYECYYRDALPSEEADSVVEGCAEDVPALCCGTEVEASRGPASRRIARRQKSVHVDGSARVISEKYFGSVVAEARCVYAARGYSEHNAELARSYMVRIMKKHGVRPSQIEERLEDMVNATFHLSESQRRAERERRAMLDMGYMKVASKQ